MDDSLDRKRRKLSVIYHFSVNIVITFFSVVFFLLFIEVTFRLILAYNDIKTIETFRDLAYTNRINNPDENITLRQMIRHSSNPRIIYELIPNLSVRFMNKKVIINSHGFRGSEPSASKGKIIIRIVGIGDSNMFGWGVNNDECYIAILQKYLNQYSSFNIEWEIINTAVPGYNTVMEIETMKENGLRYKPDIVIVGYIVNDFDLPNFIRETENYFSFQRSFAVEYFLNRLINRHKVSHTGLVDSPWNADGKRFEGDPSRVPDQYKNMVGTDAYRSAMQELKLLSSRHNFQILVFTTYFPEDVREILRGLDLPMLESGNSFTEYMRQHDIKEYMGSPLSVGDQDPHPSALGHIIMADVLFNYLKDSEMLRQIIQRRRETDAAD